MCWVWYLCCQIYVQGRGLFKLWLPYEILESGLGLPIESVLLLILFIGGVIFAAKSFQIALIYYVVCGSGLFLLLYFWSLSDPSINWVPALTFLFMSVAMVSLSVLFVKKQEVSVV